MSAMTSQITCISIVCADQRKHQTSSSLAFVRGIHRWPVESPHKGPVARTMFPFNDVIMEIRVPGPGDEIYNFQIFKWIVATWLTNRTPTYKSQWRSAGWHALSSKQSCYLDQNLYAPGRRQASIWIGDNISLIRPQRPMFSTHASWFTLNTENSNSNYRVLMMPTLPSLGGTVCVIMIIISCTPSDDKIGITTAPSFQSLMMLGVIVDKCRRLICFITHRGFMTLRYTSLNLDIIGSDNGLSLFGAKPLPKPMLNYYWLDPWDRISMKFSWNTGSCSGKIYLKMSSVMGRPCSYPDAF